MSNLHQLFSALMNQHVQNHSKLVLGFSGGMDSRVLLELLQHYRQHQACHCLVVHVHHGLSPHADSWAENCQQVCDALHIPFVIEKVQLELNNGESLERVARDARYAALAKHIEKDDILLTGQHSDDQIETFLLALKRGSGPKGLASMAQVMPFGKGMLIRPLLSVSRIKIEHYAHQHALKWVEDESNQNLRFDRNFIRHQITPLLMKRWPGFHDSVHRSAQLCADQETLLNELLADTFKLALQEDHSLSIQVLMTLSERACKQILRMWLAYLAQPMPTQKQLIIIWQQIACAQQDANPKLLLDHIEIRRFKRRLYCISVPIDVSAWTSVIDVDTPVTLPKTLGTIVLSSQGQRPNIRIPDNNKELRLTFNPEGLSANPVNRMGSRKLKKLFQEYGVPSWLRRQIPILMYQDQVVAVANLFVDRNFSGEDCELVWNK